MSLRAEMPETAAFIDALRGAFGKDEIDAQIKKGMRGLPGFYASENGHEIGTKAPPARYEISGADMVLESINPVSQPAASSRRSKF